MYEIPQSIIIDNIEHPIRNKGDYRMVLDCMNAMDDVDLTKQERIYSALIIFYDELNSVEDVLSLQNQNAYVLEMFKFINCGQMESPGASVNYKLIDWEQDSQLISSAINKVANKEIRLEPYIHWWTFMGYYLAVGESALATVVGIRNKIVKGKKLEKHESEFKKNNPNYFNRNFDSTQKRELDKYVKELWNSGK